MDKPSLPLDAGGEFDERLRGVANGENESVGLYQPTADYDEGEFLGILAAREDIKHSPNEGFRLVVVVGPDQGVGWNFRESSVCLGRDPGCNLPLVDIAVSRRHARIELDQDNTYNIEDLASNNGTRLNGKLLRQRTPLSSGDEFEIGERTFRFIRLENADIDSPKGVPTKASIWPLKALECSILSSRPRYLLLTLGRVVLLLGLTVSLLLLFGRNPRSPKVVQGRAREVNRRFLQAVALVKIERFGDAWRVLQTLVQLKADHPRLSAYQAYVDAELKNWDRLRRAERLFADGARVEARRLLRSIPPESVYADDAFRRHCWFDTHEPSAAIDQLALPSLSGQPLKMYKRTEVLAAKSWVEAHHPQGSERLVEYLARMEDILTHLRRAYQRGDGQNLQKWAREALRLNYLIVGEEKGLRIHLQSFLVEGMYQQGQVALVAQDHARAHESFMKALTVHPGHTGATKGIQKIIQQTPQMYEKAMSMWPDRTAEAYLLFKTISYTNPPTNIYRILSVPRLREVQP
ncbi:MAG: FHA domain-containing protein [Myxococcales bacterium]|nr:FHA domain-containing protein [Myxococcales bacterium]